MLARNDSAGGLPSGSPPLPAPEDSPKLMGGGVGPAVLAPDGAAPGRVLLMTSRLQSTWSPTQSPQATQATLMTPAMLLSLNPVTKLPQRSLVSLTF